MYSTRVTAAGSERRSDWDPLDQAGGLGAEQIDVQKAVLEERALHLHAVRQDEGPYEPARGDTAVQEGSVAGARGFRDGHRVDRSRRPFGLLLLDFPANIG